jgi:tetratricopeptide (TPR) repeat protein
MPTGKSEVARPSFSLAGSTNLANAFRGRSSAYAHKGDYDRAFQDHDQALQLNPIDAKAFYGRGTAYWHKVTSSRSPRQLPLFLSLPHMFATPQKSSNSALCFLALANAPCNHKSCISHLFCAFRIFAKKTRGYLFIPQFRHPI